jgi:SAM-dependent methyltransferase
MTQPGAANSPGPLGRFLRKAFVAVTPPFITTLARRVMAKPRPPAAPVDLREYSTVDNPLEMPAQAECYLLCRDRYIRKGDTVLDVGFGLGYGLNIMAAKAGKLFGVDVDEKCYRRGLRFFEGHPLVESVQLYDGTHLPFPDKSVDVITCVEVIEHVEDYRAFLLELVRVARRTVFLTTPNRRPEHTRPDGKPTNYWHLREWTQPQLQAVLDELNLKTDWNCLNGPLMGPFAWTREVTPETLTLAPAILLGPGPEAETG